MVQSKGRACCRGRMSLEGKVGTQMEGTECEISALLSPQQPAESSCFHRMKSHPWAGQFPKVRGGPRRGLGRCQGVTVLPIGHAARSRPSFNTMGEKI